MRYPRRDHGVGARAVANFYFPYIYVRLGKGKRDGVLSLRHHHHEAWGGIRRRCFVGVYEGYIPRVFRVCLVYLGKSLLKEEEEPETGETH